MTAFHGKSGKVDWNSSVLISATNQATDWNLNTSIELARATKMGDSWEVRKAGFGDFTATTECIWPSEIDPTGFIGVSAAFKMYIDADH